MENILANKAVGISELKQNPSAVLSIVAEEPVAILNRNKTAGYIVSPALWEALSEYLEDIELAKIATERLNDGETPIKVTLDEL